MTYFSFLCALWVGGRAVSAMDLRAGQAEAAEKIAI
jgi:hypothetical protein